MKPQKVTLALMVALICFGFALRLYRINVVPLRGDEAFTVLNWMRQPLSDTLVNVATRDPQPPLAYLTYYLYGLVVGADENRVRFLPALLSLIGIPALYGLGRRVGGWRVGWLAALLWVINPYQVWHAQDARNYAIWAALSPVALWLALRVLDRRKLIDWILYILLASVTLYFYYLELFVVFTLSVYVFLIYWRDRSLLSRWVVCQAVIALVLAPWYFQERLLFGSDYGGTAARFDPLGWFTYFAPSLLFGEIFARQLATLPKLLLAGVVLLFLGVLVVGWVFVWRLDRRKAVLLGLLGTIPLVLLGIASLRLNVFTPRYVLAVSPVYVLLLAVVLLRGWSLARARVLNGVAFLIFCVVVLSINVFTLFAYYVVSDYAKSPDWRSLSSYLAERTSSDDLILNTSADEAFTFYHTEYDVHADQIRLPASDGQPTDEIQRILADSQRQYDSIWIAAQTPPSWRTAGIVETWLAEHMQSVRQTNTNGLHAQQFMNWEVDPIPQRPLTTYAEIAELADAQALLPPEPTDELTIWLYWRPIGTSPTPLKVFVHLLGEINPVTGTPLWTQDDQYPQNGRISTTNWMVSTIYRDVYTLPLETVPPGEYALTIGLYDPDTNERIPVDGSDYFILQPITISDYTK
jgi:4-amino-4-deoxy-L-arabinose transferase-like glycosyltransferase